MGSLNRLFDLAAKALDSSGSQAASGSQASGNGRDWRAMVRDVAGAVSGEPRSTTPPTASDSWTPPAAASPAPAVG
ncbi:MAG TPA: cation-transporting ATPase, partial [Microbacterium sp.]